MPHLTEDDLVLHYYGELPADAAARTAAHLSECGTCRAALTRLQRVFAMIDAAPEALVGDGFERTVWARLEPGLAPSSRNWAAWLVFSPVRLAWLALIVALVGASFFAGRLSQPHGGASSPVPVAAANDLRERVLLAALAEHLDRSQLMLVDLVSGGGDGEIDLASERARAEQLLPANRLYRQTAVETGNRALAQVLDDLEQALVDIAAAPDRVSEDDLGAIRQRIDDKGLLLEVRVLSSEVQKRQRRQISARAGQSS